MTDQLVEICPDGAFSGNPGPGGWGAVSRYGTVERADRLAVRGMEEALTPPR